MECQYIWKIKERQIRYPVDLSGIDRTFSRRIHRKRKIKETGNSIRSNHFDRLTEFLINFDKGLDENIFTLSSRFRELFPR